MPEFDFEAISAELSDLLNKHNVDNACSTPDYILADMLVAALMTYQATNMRRETWFGR
jgi:hypothetical protein